jgi:carbon monoxide dehydrogenase subunit G
MLHFEGDKDLKAQVSDVFAKLSDAGFLVQCIPGVVSVAQAEVERAVCVIRPGFSFVRGTLEITLLVTETVPSTSTRLSIHSKGIGTTSDVEATLAFTSAEAATRVHWSADITQLGGLLKAVPQGLIKGAAQKVIADIWTAVEARID